MFTLFTMLLTVYYYIEKHIVQRFNPSLVSLLKYSFIGAIS